jgi:D-arabinose 1-dehydrogenase-like Zn-dependent alcohol dehydrogenase
MKAAVIETFGSIVVREMADPVPGDYEVLCELLYGSTCTGTDLHILDGVFPWISKLPTVLGHESVGRVVALGRKVRHYRIGDLVTRVGTPPSRDGAISVTWGGFATHGTAKDHWAMCADGLPPQEWQGSRWNQVLPHGMDPTAGPMFTTWRETLSYLLKMGVTPGASVLVAGSGGNGLSFAAMAKLLGASVVAMIGSPVFECQARTLGVTKFADYKRNPIDSELKACAGGGFDFVVDSVGRIGNADRLIPLLREGGVFGAYGLDDMGKWTINPANAGIRFTVHPCRYDESETHSLVAQWVLQGKLNAGVWYDTSRPYTLAAIADALEDVRQRKAPKGLVRLHA